MMYKYEYACRVDASLNPRAWAEAVSDRIPQSSPFIRNVRQVPDMPVYSESLTILKKEIQSLKQQLEEAKDAIHNRDIEIDSAHKVIEDQREHIESIRKLAYEEADGLREELRKARSSHEEQRLQSAAHIQMIDAIWATISPRILDLINNGLAGRNKRG